MPFMGTRARRAAAWLVLIACVACRRAGGTLGDPVSSVTLRNVEAAILFK
jgi:hypothetical protein